VYLVHYPSGGLTRRLTAAAAKIRKKSGLYGTATIMGVIGDLVTEKQYRFAVPITFSKHENEKKCEKKKSFPGRHSILFKEPLHIFPV